ncbi:MAG: inositol oxygenase family protein [Acidobacteriota bacterium]
MQVRESGSPLLPKPVEKFRDYEHARPKVEEFYALNHTHQTLDFVLAKKQDYLALNRKRMTVFEALEFLNTLVDDSDPDIDFTQIEHALQTAEAIRAANQPRWFIATGLVHDLGKILCLFGEPQWAVVGDTFPVGCRWSPTIVYSQFFRDNPDLQVPEYQTEYGIYEPGCGLDRVHLSWGHDEYVYHAVRDRLPLESLYMLRYHSFYPWHKEGDYSGLTDETDRSMVKWVRAFNRYDLYSKGAARPNVQELMPFYEGLVKEFFPEPINW